MPLLANVVLRSIRDIWSHGLKEHRRAALVWTEGKMKTVILTWLAILASSSYLHAEDCAKQFKIGEFGIPQSDSIAASTLPDGKRYKPVYMEKREVHVKPELCPFTYPLDVFQLHLKRDPRFLLAGCYGDVNSDGKRDYVLLLRHIADDRIQLHVFIHTPGGYRDIPLQTPAALKDYEQDIPHCIRKPPDGIFRGFDEDKFTVTGDVISYGWFSYYWEGNGLKEIITRD